VWKTYARTFKGRTSSNGAWAPGGCSTSTTYRFAGLFCEGVWEEDQVAAPDRLMRRRFGESAAKPHFLDIGSHAGFYAVLMRQSGLCDRVLAFEPLPAHIALLNANLALNDLAGAVEGFRLRAQRMPQGRASLRARAEDQPRHGAHSGWRLHRPSVGDAEGRDHRGEIPPTR